MRNTLMTHVRSREGQGSKCSVFTFFGPNIGYTGRKELTQGAGTCLQNVPQDSGVFRKSSGGDNPRRAHIPTLTTPGGKGTTPVPKGQPGTSRAFFVDFLWDTTFDQYFVDLF